MSPKPLVGRLTDDRIRRLQDLGFVWSLRDDWQKHYEELKGKSVFVSFVTQAIIVLSNRLTGLTLQNTRGCMETVTFPLDTPKIVGWEFGSAHSGSSIRS